jgi:hypothetical protein
MQYEVRRGPGEECRVLVLFVRRAAKLERPVLRLVVGHAPAANQDARPVSRRGLPRRDGGSGFHTHPGRLRDFLLGGEDLDALARSQAAREPISGKPSPLKGEEVCDWVCELGLEVRSLTVVTLPDLDLPAGTPERPEAEPTAQPLMAVAQHTYIVCARRASEPHEIRRRIADARAHGALPAGRQPNPRRGSDRPPMN